MQGAGGVALGGVVDDVDVDEQSHLVEVGRHQRRERKQLTPKRIQRARVQQRIAVHRRAHRVDDQRYDTGQIPGVPGVGDRRDDVRRRQHARLGGLNADIVDDGFDLAGDDVERDLVKPLTPIEFCTVTAVTATQPCMPSNANVRMSAWMPAPPPESEPAIVMTRSGV